VAPGAVEFGPEGQAVHALAAPVEYVPAGHVVHAVAPVPGANKPAVQPTQLVAPDVDEYVLAGQLVQTLAPATE